MTYEKSGVWQPPDGWHYRTLRHASHVCGWTEVGPFDAPWELQAKVDAHAEACPWPDMPEVEERLVG